MSTMSPATAGGIIPAYAGSTGSISSAGRSLADHPRIRGEHFVAVDDVEERMGSSPHTRGAPKYSRECDMDGRIIPAYAGSTLSQARQLKSKKDHPRIRGEHPRSCSTVAVSLGSSPHTRGARPAHRRRRRPPRIIPAYAGSTNQRHDPKGDFTDHPRIRGEHVHSGPDRFQVVGIIPAYAGSTFFRMYLLSDSSDHPRIRGEHRPRGFRSAPGLGSSPHTRGAPRRRVRHRRYPGIIPAYAGSTAAHRRHGRGVWDHPRIRGEHSTRWSSPSWNPGSSPHTRGALAED